jgi:ketosteroid isomerase-like protein
MNAPLLGTAISAVVLGAARAEASDHGAISSNASIDSLNARLAQSYRDADPRAYAQLYTDSAVFEWPAFNTVRGRAGLERMARTNWASLDDMDLELDVASRRVARDLAVEFGAFELSYRDSSRVRAVEFGRYVVVLAREGDGTWRIDRFFGFADSTRPAPAPP